MADNDPFGEAIERDKEAMAEYAATARKQARVKRLLSRRSAELVALAVCLAIVLSTPLRAILLDAGAQWVVRFAQLTSSASAAMSNGTYGDLASWPFLRDFGTTTLMATIGIGLAWATFGLVVTLVDGLFGMLRRCLGAA